MTRINFSVALLLLLFCSQDIVRGQSLYFPPTTGPSWDTLSPSSLGWCQPGIDSLYAYLDREDSKAFILLKGGKIVLEKYFDAFTVDSLWYWASAGKTLTAFTVGVAQQESHLSISDTTSDYLGTGWTVCTPTQEEKITIRHQLTMTSGLNDGVPDHYCTLDTCLQYYSNAGTRWAYHNGPYTLLDGVIANATGQSLNTYFSAKIRNPIGMNGLFVQSGYNNVYVSNARSMARFGLLMLGEGNWNGTPIMTDTAYFQQMITTSQNLNPSYGYLWWLNGKASYMVPGLQFNFPGYMCPLAPADMYAALGKNGQIINVVPSQDLVWVRMGNAPSSAEVPYFMVDSVWLRLSNMGCASSAQQALSEQIQVFPNPVSRHFRLEVSDQTEVSGLSIADLAGRVVWEMGKGNDAEGSHTLPNGLTAGLYYLRISTNEGVLLKKIQIRE